MKKQIIYVLSFIFALTTFSCNENKQEEKFPFYDRVNEQKQTKMILDLDTGIDDAMALAYALGSPEIDLLGVVTTYGNVSTETSYNNTLSILELLNRTEIPVYEGERHAITDNEDYLPIESVKLIHGDNGIGNLTIPKAKRRVENQNGIDFIIESAKKYGKDLTIVAVGPLTNLERAMDKEPKLKEMVGKIVIMGGALTVEGNVTPIAEANIIKDPVAANNVFQSGMPLTMVGLDVTLQTVLTRKETQEWRKLKTESGKFFANMVDFYISSYETNQPEIRGCGLHDPLAVAVAIHPELVQTMSLYMRVGTDDKDWGRTIRDVAKFKDEDPNVEVCLNVDYDIFCKDFFDVLTHLFKEN